MNFTLIFFLYFFSFLLTYPYLASCFAGVQQGHLFALITSDKTVSLSLFVFLFSQLEENKVSGLITSLKQKYVNHISTPLTALRLMNMLEYTKFTLRRFNLR